MIFLVTCLHTLLHSMPLTVSITDYAGSLNLPKPIAKQVLWHMFCVREIITQKYISSTWQIPICSTNLSSNKSEQAQEWSGSQTLPEWRTYIITQRRIRRKVCDGVRLGIFFCDLQISILKKKESTIYFFPPLHFSSTGSDFWRLC